MKIKNLLNNLPIITTRKRIDDEIIGCMMTLEKVNNLHKFATLNPIIHDLEKLKANTWDKDKVEQIQQWLRDYINE